MPRELMSTRAFWVLICVTTCVNLNEWVRLWVLWPKHYWYSEYSTTILCVLYWILVIINTCNLVRFLDENVRNLFLSNHFTILQKKWKNHVFVSAKNPQCRLSQINTNITQMNENITRKSKCESTKNSKRENFLLLKIWKRNSYGVLLSHIRLWSSKTKWMTRFVMSYLLQWHQLSKSVTIFT